MTGYDEAILNGIKQAFPGRTTVTTAEVSRQAGQPRVRRNWLREHAYKPNAKTFDFSDEGLALRASGARKAKAVRVQGTPRTPKAPKAPRVVRDEHLKIDPNVPSIFDGLTDFEKARNWDDMMIHPGSRSMIIGQIIEREWSKMLAFLGIKDNGKPTKLDARSDNLTEYGGRNWGVQVKELCPKDLRRDGGVKASVGMRDQKERKCLNGDVIRTTHYPYGSFDICAVPAYYVTGNKNSWFVCAEWHLENNANARTNGVSPQIIKPTQEITLNTHGGFWHLVDSRESFDTFMTEITTEWNADPYLPWKK